MSKERLRLALALVATLAIVAPLAYLWQHSRIGTPYDVMSMGYADYGGGARGMGAGRTVSVRDLTGDDTDRAPDVTVDLVARQQKVRLASGQELDGYTLNGKTPGPLIKVTQGQLLEVRLRNANVSGGITLHWHGVDVPNAEDGVAGVTQDAVRPGRSFTYRFVARDAGTYWYHSHQVSHDQVIRGLLGPLVVEPRGDRSAARDEVALVHTYDGRATVNGQRALKIGARPGERVRVRVVNTDNGPTRAWSDAPYTVAAVDGREVHQPTPVRGKAVLVTAGGRDDLELTAPEDGSGARLQIGDTGVVVGGTPAKVPPQPSGNVDLLSYGEPAPLGFDPAKADRHFRYAIGRRPGFVRGKPGLWWSINGHLFPHVPMFVVRQGDVVRMRIKNSSGDVHPMHLHGHHAVVLSRNGVEATGSPWWFDSLDVANGDTYDVAFVADNPGVWMDHCHNLTHANQGLVAHLMYAGVTTPYRVGGRAENQPE